MAVLNLYHCGKVQVTTIDIDLLENGAKLGTMPSLQCSTVTRSLTSIYLHFLSLVSTTERIHAFHIIISIFRMYPLQDGALISLAKCCTGLVSLNIALVGRITDAGVSALSRGCPCLQALNLAGAKQASAVE